MTQSTGDDFDLARYLARVGLEVTPSADEAGLAAVQEAQVRAIPFENFDVLFRKGPLGSGPSVDPAVVDAKLLAGGRGGYCFELNGLLLRALSALGFEARPLLARVLVRWQEGQPPGPRTHLVNLVTLGERAWIADAGFGGALPLRPIPLEEGTEHVQLGATLRYQRHELGWMLQMQKPEGWKALYVFGLEHAHPGDIVMGNHFTSTYPMSPFVRGPFVTRPEGERRLVLNADAFVVHEGDRVETSPSPRGDALRTLLRERFAIVLDELPEALR